jgi:hypothetical protein
LSKPERRAVALSTSKRIRGHYGVHQDVLGKMPSSANAPCV